MSQTQAKEAQAALAAAHAAVRAGDREAAVAAFREASALGISPKLTAQPHALALSDLGRHEEAVAVYEPWFRKNPKAYDVCNVMGVLLKRAGRLQDALGVLERARKLRPQLVSAWQNIGNIHDLLGNPAQAAEAFRGALKIEPRSAELWRLHGRAVAATGDLEKALESFRRALTLAPRDPRVVSVNADVLERLGRLDEARELLARVGEATSSPDMSVVSARLAFRSGDADGAVVTLREVLAREPGHLNGNLLLASILGDGDRRGANEALDRAVAANPGSVEALERLVDSLVRSRYGSEVEHLEAAYRLVKRLMAEFPSRILDSARTLRTVLMRVLDEPRMAETGRLATLLPVFAADGKHSNVHYELGQVESLEDRIALVEWHRAWGRRVASAIRPVERPAMPALGSGRKLRIGFMSSDLRNHPVTYFALPLLEEYDRDRVEVFCYSFFEREPDRVQRTLEEQVTAFRHWPKRPAGQVAEGIAADGLDILFELGGSTAMNKLDVMAYRPARIGASWLGYPHSAGLEEIDLILVDPFIRPEDPRLLIERPFEMPETWVAISRMFAEREIAADVPESRKGRLTFGTANNPYKFTGACLDAWAAVLRAVPGSRFLFLRPEAGSPSFVENSRAAFARRDVDPDRLDFIGVRGDHMRHYNEIDIALDSLPHVGGTTTCEALWMGVPTVTLAGPGFAERLAYSNLSNAGLGDLAAFSVEEYVAKAAALAEDRARRLALRHGLRDQIRRNPLGDTRRFTRHFYDRAAQVAAA